MVKRERHSSSDDFPETQFIAQSDDSDNLWEVLEILGERGPPKTGDYLVKWKGIDTSTGKPWEPSWTQKSACTQGLINDWKAKKARRSKSGSVIAENAKEEKVTTKSKRRKIDSDTEKKKKYNVSVELKTRKPRSKPKSTFVVKQSTSPQAIPRRTRNNKMTSISLSPSNTDSSVQVAKTTRRTRAQTGRPLHTPSVEPESSTSPHPPARSLSGKRVIDLTEAESSETEETSTLATAGPGPSTTANRSQRSTPSKSSAKPRLGPVPVPSPTVFQPFLNGPKGIETQVPNLSNGSGSNEPSQVDPIRQFSTPPRKSPKNADKTDVPSNNEGNEDRPPKSNIPDPEAHSSDAKLRSWTPIARDGDVGEMRPSSDDESVDHGITATEGQNHIAIEEDLDDADLDIVNSEHEGGDEDDEAQNVDKAAEDDRDGPIQPVLVEPKPPSPPTALSQPHPDTLALIESHNRISQLEAELQEAKTPKIHPDTELLAQVREQVRNLETALEEARRSTLATTPAEPVTDSRIAQLEADISKLERNKASLTSDNSFVRHQYDEASNRAVAEVQAGNILKEQVETLKSQLSVGLKQRHAHFEKIAKDKATEAAKLRGQVKILLDQARLTDDGVRKRAVFYTQYKKENENLLERLGLQNQLIESLEKRNETLSERNDELVDQLDTLRAMKMGIIPDDEEEEGDGSDTDDEILRQVRDESGMRMPGTPSNPKNNVFVPSAYPPQDVENFPKSGYLCAWRNGGEQCKMICETVEQLADHGVTHQRNDVMRSL
ncbi:uncharacterized protein IL334_003144 [Kwoniella shivajii]|uniref:Chromo domain-containing protein n=1 Tax=Kwoniella shivajii TaxID=564305 RepID=A0ABZ1CWQ5_9TREE|nr:hypothetical protein IL334_003144 [Kwoniella shivajii]